MIVVFWLFVLCVLVINFFFFNDTATTEIYTLSLHDALPISFNFVIFGLTPANEKHYVTVVALEVLCLFKTTAQ